MAALRRGSRKPLVATVIVAVLAVAATPAAAQPTNARTADPADVVDVENFEDRAQRWAEARRRARQEALRKAEELAIANRNTTSTTTSTTTTTTTTTTTSTTSTTTTTTTTTTVPPTTTSTEAAAGAHPLPAGTTEEQWHALRECESTQNYRAVSRSGRYRGAYQFARSTWDWVAGMHYPELVGIDPRDASPADQDKMAYKLYEINGWQPWPTCRKRLPS